MHRRHERGGRGISRRDLLRSAGAAGAGVALGVGNALAQEPRRGERERARRSSVIGLKFEPKPIVRLGLIGVGARGTSMLANWLALEGLEIKAVCDLVPQHAEAASAQIVRAGKPAPELYTNGERDFERLCQRGDLDVVYIATPWDWHVPMAVAAMKQGIHAAVEVPAAETLDECWELVNTSEATQRHCVMMENCCYGESELVVLNMVRAGVFGDLLHGGAGYVHDLRALLFEDRSEGLWRRAEHIGRDGNLYPTHGLGPVANYMTINRGDRFESLVSMSSPSLGLQAYRAANVPRENAKWKERYECGDRNISLIKTAKGRIIRLEHDVSSPHPYSRINAIAGTRGLFEDYPPRVYLDGQEGGEQWVSLDEHKAKYEHALWKKAGELARKLGGHGGMDFVMCYRLVECMRDGLEPDMDVYDAAAWSAPTPLSEASVSKGGAPVKFPDFTRGGWTQTRTPIATSATSA
jgi:hypothetical protein